MKIETKEFFNKNIFDITLQNTLYRKEIVTGLHSQVVIMCIPEGQDIGEEIHSVDQILVFVEGSGQAIINDIVSDVEYGHLVFVPSGTKHNFKNIGSGDLKLFTIYAPAEEKIGTIEKKKNE
ncbi:MAG TPA: cupin domain-containing protein [Candidatus Babeliales bacterium]|nr:cupin domain-containing protein [Candidatus Babeliales bacterium]